MALYDAKSTATCQHAATVLLPHLRQVADNPDKHREQIAICYLLAEALSARAPCFASVILNLPGRSSVISPQNPHDRTPPTSTLTRDRIHSIMRRTTDPSPEHPESPAPRIPTNTPDSPAKPTSATPLNARGQLTLLTAQVSDALASSIQAIAMPLLTYGATGDLAQSAIVMVVEAIPVFLFAPFAGTIADKFNRKTLTVSFRLASAALLIASPALYAAAGLPAFLTIALLVSTFGTFSSPAASAAMPSLLGDDYQKYMARRGSLIFLAQTLGPTIAAAVASFTTPALAVGFAGTLNLLAALTVATIRNYDLTHAERTATVQEHHTGRLLREGAAYTAHNPVVRGMLTFWFLSIAAVPITTLPMLEYLTRDLGHDYTAFGIATSVYAAGCVISSWLSAKIGVGTGAGRVRMTKRGWMCISGLGYGAVCLSMGLHPALWAVLVLWFTWGMFYGPEEVLGQVLFADAIDEHMRGRVYSFMGVVFSLAGMVGYLITGWAVPAFGAINTIVAGGSLFVIATVFTFILGPTARAIRGQEARDETKNRAGA